MDGSQGSFQGGHRSAALGFLEMRGPLQQQQRPHPACGHDAARCNLNLPSESHINATADCTAFSVQWRCAESAHLRLRSLHDARGALISRWGSLLQVQMVQHNPCRAGALSKIALKLPALPDRSVLFAEAAEMNKTEATIVEDTPLTNGNAHSQPAEAAELAQPLLRVGLLLLHAFQGACCMQSACFGDCLHRICIMSCKACCPPAADP